MKRAVCVAAVLLSLGCPARAATVDYVTSVKDKLWEQEVRHKSEVPAHSTFPKISFHINADGSIKEARIVESSGDKEFDETVLKWVQLAAPFPPPPNGVVHFTWDFLWSADLASYMEKLQQHIKNKWKPPKTQTNRSVVVDFWIDRNGQITRKSIYDSSNDGKKDQAALNALTAANPVPPLPAGAPKMVAIRFNFGDAPQMMGRTPSSTGYRTAAELNNEGVKALNNREFDRAIALFTDIVRKFPKYPYAKENLVIAYNNYALTLKASDAAKMFYRAMYLDGSNKTTQSNLIQTLRKAGTKVKTPQQHLQLAHQLKEKGDFVGAAVHCSIAENMKPTAESKKLAQDLHEPARKQFENLVGISP